MTIILYDIASKVPGSAWNVNTWKARYVLTLSPNNQRYSNSRIDSAWTIKVSLIKRNGSSTRKSRLTASNMAYPPRPRNPMGRPFTPFRPYTILPRGHTYRTRSPSPHISMQHTHRHPPYSHMALKASKPRSKAHSRRKCGICGQPCISISSLTSMIRVQIIWVPARYLGRV